MCGSTHELTLFHLIFMTRNYFSGYCFIVVLIVLSTFVFVGCNSGATTEEASEETDFTYEADNLRSWASDTVYSLNPELLGLLDTLYQHVRSNTFPSNARNEEKWMSEYRQRLCAYYDAHKMGDDTVSVYAKADTVLNEGVRLIESDEDWSTMGTIVKNSMERTFDVLREYGLLTQLVAHCGSEKLQELVYQEWDLYGKLSKKMMSVSTGITTLRYFGGSYIGMVTSGTALEISASRREMIQTILDINEGESWENKGINLDIAQRLLLECSIKEVKSIVAEMKSDPSDSPYGEKNSKIRYEEEIMATEKAIDELRPLLKKWCVLWANIDKEMPSAQSHDMEHAASYMLMNWAIITSTR